MTRLPALILFLALCPMLLLWTLLAGLLTRSEGTPTEDTRLPPSREEE